MTKPDILCPVTGEICPTKEHLAQLFVGNHHKVDAETRVSDDELYQDYLRSQNFGTVACHGFTEAGECGVVRPVDQQVVQPSLATRS